MCSAKSCLYSLFIDDKSSSTPFAVVLTGFSLRLLFLISYKSPARFVDARGAKGGRFPPPPRVGGGGRFKIGGGGRKLSVKEVSDALVFSSSIYSLIISKCFC